MKIKDKLNDSQYFQTFKKVWDNKRYHALIVLGFYIIFIILIVTFLGQPKNSINTSLDLKKTPFEILEQADGYEYSISITKEPVDDYNIDGIRYKDEELITFDNQKYYINDLLFYKVTDNKIQLSSSIMELDLCKLKASIILSMIKNSNPINNISYTDGTIKKEYNISTASFIKAYENEETDNLEIVSIITYENTKEITKIELDLTNIMKYKGYTFTYYKLEIEYKNIDQITKLETNYEIFNEVE